MASSGPGGASAAAPLPAAAAAASRSPIGCTPAGADPSAAAFRAWCDSERILWPKCAVGESPVTGRCVVATQDIQQGEVVVEVPDDAVLMVENCSIVELLAEAGLCKPAADALLEVQGLVLAVMHEKALGPKSRWAPYLAFLPGSMDHMPVYWEPEELAELRGTAAADKMAGRVQHPADAPTRVDELFEGLVLPLVQGDKQLAKTLLGPKGLPSKGAVAEEAQQKLLQQYKWATCAVASYSFILGDDQFQSMCPVWDALNHVTGKVNVRLHHDPERSVLQMVATEAIPAGREVVNCYGRLSNADLLRGYGYVEADNENEHAQVPAQFVIRAAAAVKGSSSGGGGGGEAGGGGGGGGGGSGGSEGGEGEEEDDDSDDGEVYDRDEDESSSDDSEASEPDYELEDDESSSSGDDSGSAAAGDAAAGGGGSGEKGNGSGRAAAVAPRLSEAVEVIHDWEDRWALAHTLKLLPKGCTFAVFSDGGDGGSSASNGGGGGGVHGGLGAFAALLLAGVPACKRLLRIVEGAGKGGEGEEAAAGVAELKLPPGAALRQVLATTARLMLARYPTSLQEDGAALKALASLPPRRAAALVARAGEKRCLHALLQAVEAASDESLEAAARGAVAAAVGALAARRRAKAAAAAAAAGSNDGGSEGESEEDGESEDEKLEEPAEGGKRRRRGGGGEGWPQAPQGSGGETGASFSFGFKV